MADLPWKEGINALCHASHLRARSAPLDKRRGLQKPGRCRLRAAEGNARARAHPDNAIICIFVQIAPCYIMVLYTAGYLT